MNRLKQLRLDKRLRQSDLAAMLNTKAQTISRYENGDRGLDVETIESLCSIFECTSDYLLGFSSIKNPELTPEEEQLINAWRRADQHSREIVGVALAPFIAQGQESEAI